MVSWVEILLRLGLATALGSIVGFERERGERSAGLRTHALVGLGAALFMSASAFGFGDVLVGRNIVLDPSRIAAQVASGIGFLGAGVIVFQRHIVRGLTTAASVWTVAAIGLASGAGMYIAAAGATALTLLVLAGMKPVERLWFRRRTADLVVLTDRTPAALSAIRQTMDANSIDFNQLVVYPSTRGGPDRIELIEASATGDRMNSAIDALCRLAGVHEVRWRR
jgi:putative Mg2+ transporter-C (MgtC) family protein